MILNEAYATIIDSEKIQEEIKRIINLVLTLIIVKTLISLGNSIRRFYCTSKTQNTVLVASGSSVIDVDSTIGFPDRGQIHVNGNSGILTYSI